MIELVIQLYKTLNFIQRRRLIKLQILAATAAAGELFGISLIGPFMAVMADANILNTNPILIGLSEITGVNEPSKIIFMLGILVLFCLIVSALFSILATWRLSTFATSLGTEIGDTLFAFYMTRGWTYHAKANSSDLTKKIANEAIRVTGQVLLPLMLMNAKLFTIVTMLGALLYVDYVVAIFGLAILPYPTPYYS
jgi:ATP-binding cassette, subfamily B, bacterial PglK